ncbi:MAG: hypothetical protein GXO83_08080 [Chlorobi bacterium]|nr:hypothetical protein [Chlorobiota bacterium]
MKKSVLFFLNPKSILLLVLLQPVFSLSGRTMVVQNPDSLRRAEIHSHYRYMASMSLGLLPGSNKVTYFVPVSLQVSQGFLHISGVYTGLTIGVETFHPDILPVAFELRRYLLHGSIHPWIGFKTGYSISLNEESYFSWASDYSGGFTFGGGGGISYDISDKASFWFSLGYRYQELRGKTTDYYNHTSTNILKYNRVEFRLGVSFH